MIEVLREAFGVDATSACITETNQDVIHIYDCIDCEPALQKSYIKTREEEPIHFTLHNPQQSILCFAAVDNCLLNPADQSRCDFVIGNQKKLYVVEVKNTKTKQRSEAKKDAVKQLEATITHLKNHINPETTQYIAVICLKAKETYPLRSATKANDVVKFKAHHNATLMEGQEDVF